MSAHFERGTYHSMANTRVINFFKVGIANRNIEIECVSNRPFIFCRDYLARFDKPDFVISVNHDVITDELSRTPLIASLEDGQNSGVATEVAGVEELAVLRQIAHTLLDFDTILIHGVAVVADNRGYIFIAPSGTGKTTHALNWLNTIPDSFVLNGDKPFVDVNTKTIFGSPWCGKEGMNVNSSAPLSAIIDLQRGVENRIKRISFHEMLPNLIRQTHIPDNRELSLKTIQLIGGLADVPCYRLSCNVNPKSALVAYEGLVSLNAGE